MLHKSGKLKACQSRAQAVQGHVKSFIRIFTCALLSVSCFAHGQSFGLPLLKSRVTLQRKLPAFIRLPGDKVKLVVIAHANTGDLTEDFKSMLSSELLQNNPSLQIEEGHPDAILTCTITEFAHPKPVVSTRPGVPTKKGGTTTESVTRVTGLMRISFLARTHLGKTIGADNVVAKFDEEYENAGNSISPGVVIDITKRSMKQITGAKSEDYNPPTEPQLRAPIAEQCSATDCGPGCEHTRVCTSVPGQGKRSGPRGERSRGRTMEPRIRNLGVCSAASEAG